MVQKINPHPATGCNRSPPYYVFSKDTILGSVPSISSEVLVLFDEIVSKASVFETLRAHCLSKYLIKSNLKAKDLDFKKVLAPLLSSY